MLKENGEATYYEKKTALKASRGTRAVPLKTNYRLSADKMGLL